MHVSHDSIYLYRIERRKGEKNTQRTGINERLKNVLWWLLELLYSFIVLRHGTRRHYSRGTKREVIYFRQRIEAKDDIWGKSLSSNNDSPRHPLSSEADKQKKLFLVERWHKEICKRMTREAMRYRQTIIHNENSYHQTITKLGIFYRQNMKR